MMAECPPVTVEGDWSPAQTRTVNNKLQIYFGSRKKSGGGGGCRVETDAGAPRAAVFFSSAEVRERVLARNNHEIVVDNKTVKLRLSSAPSSVSSDAASASTKASEDSQPDPGSGTSKDGGKCESEAVSSVAIVLAKVKSDMPRDLLSMLVENVSGLDESNYSLEIIWETNKAVVTFNRPVDVERFQSSQRLQSQGLTARLLEAAQSVRVEHLPRTMVKDILELYFEKIWSHPDRVVMIADEQAAIVSFDDPAVVKSICIKQDYDIRSTPVKVYPYYESLGTALYGKDRPSWQLPKPFIEKVQHAIWKFLQLKKLSKSINDQMRAYFCSVDLNGSDVKLSPLPVFLRQPGLNAKLVDSWQGTAQEAFRQLLSQYTAFECTVNAAAWKAAEKDVRLTAREDAALVIDAPRDLLTVAGRADHIKQIRGAVEKIVSEAMSQIQRQTRAVVEDVDLSPPMFYILQQEGLDKARQDISPDMKLSYNGATHKLAITGLPAEVFQTKTWILERKIAMSKKQIDVSPGLLDFLKIMDPVDLSQDLFISQGICVIFSIENKGVLLVGSSQSALNDAENKLQTTLSQQTVVIEDPEVLQHPHWSVLNQQLLDNYNSSRKKTVAIQRHPERRDSMLVSGFHNPVKEVSRGLEEFIFNHTRVQEALRVKSCAVIKFIMTKKTQELSTITQDNAVKIHFDEERPKMTIAGARIHVQNAKTCLQELTSALSTDSFVIDKPGAKKYFLSQGSFVLPSLMIDLNCVVVLGSESQEEEDDDDENSGQEVCHCKVRTASGVLVLVTMANICRLGVDAVVNAANETLQHEGGVAFALLKAAGPELQKISDDYIARKGGLRPGDAVVTGACNLPCKYVVHAVGPRFHNHDKQTSVSLLKRAIKQSLVEAAKVNCSSIALPAISSGVFGFPVGLCADTIAEAVREYCDSVEGPGSVTEIHLVDNNAKTVKELAASVNTVFSDLEPTMTAPQQAAGEDAAASGYRQGQGEGHFSGGQGELGKGHHLDDRRGGQRGGRAQGGHPGDKRAQNPVHHGRPGGRPEGLKQTTAEGLNIVLCKGNIQDQTTCVIVNTIAENLNLNQGAVSKALLQAAGSKLQSAVRAAPGKATRYGDVVITDGFKLSCRKVFHAVCPLWDNGAGNAEKNLTLIIRFCLEEAEKLQMRSLSFPAIGTGNLNFPRDLVCGILLREIHSFSSRRGSRHLGHVFVVVHPADTETDATFTRHFGAQSPRRNIQDRDVFQPEHIQSSSRSQQSTGSTSFFSRVSSPTLGVYQIQMGPITFEVSSGDITKEASDAIINSSNHEFNLKSGVSKAILDGGGPTVQWECEEIVKAPGYQRQSMIMTSAGQLPSKNIIHVVVGTNDPARIKDIVYSVLKLCEENKFNSVAFPALGTGQGGTSPSAVADAMVDAVVDFVKKKQPKHVRSVKILIFQTVMMTEFHKSMLKREGEQVQEKGVFTFLKDKITSFLGFGEEQPVVHPLVLEKKEFEPTMFQLCAENNRALNQAKQRVRDLIVAEHAEKVIRDQYIGHLSQTDMNDISALQRQLTVSISLEKGQQDQEPFIRLEGLTRDVFTADAEVRSIIQRVERAENKKHKALMISEKVEWQFQQDDGTMVPFDADTNLILEEAYEKKRTNVKISINNEPYHADVMTRKASSASRYKEVELRRKDINAAALPPEWEDMKDDQVKIVRLLVGSTEYNDVEAKTKMTGLNANIISIERIQNATLWKSYQLMKTQMEVKNKHKKNERQLFHGTDAKSVEFINHRGFDRGFAGAHAAVFGKGTYFAVNATYSANGYAQPDSNGHKRMYLARVLVGDFTKGKNGLITPPNKSSGNATDLYDSVTDNVSNPTMFVVFGDNNAYPEYLITFQ